MTVEPSERDRRVRIARLTDRGRAERAVLDERSDDIAGSFLAPLNAKQRTRLVEAMGEVDRLLTAGLVAVAPTDPDHPHARHCLAACFGLPGGRAVQRRVLRPPLVREGPQPALKTTVRSMTKLMAVATPWATTHATMMGRLSASISAFVPTLTKNVTV
ncbi:hypothetical protein CLV71_106358 [Actinophytocola oryzae]|uniref:Uncharacterized protein n=1 Tax=Actinophytocola oryzae TaxID=502181 RepID=A0A4R7VNA4_9PSEU|nr:hypothetical protein CLV71_106358 [Actinophytocola oryzae]